MFRYIEIGSLPLWVEGRAPVGGVCALEEKNVARGRQ